MPGALKPVASYLVENIDNIVFSSAYDPPFETALYIATLEEVGLAMGDPVEVTPTVINEKIIVPLQINSDIPNCGFSSVTDTISTKSFTLADASFIDAAGGDRVQCVDADGVIIGTSTRVMSKTGDTVVLQDDFTDVDQIRLMVSYLAVCIGTDVVKWKSFETFKKSGDDYPVQLQVNVN